MNRLAVPKLRYNVWDLFKFQVMLSPLFLAFAYADYESHASQFNPFKSLAWFLAPPMLYTLFFVILKLRQKAPRSYTFAGIRWGIVFGLLFAGLSWGPLGVPAIVAAIGNFGKLLGLAIRNRPFSYAMLIDISLETLTEVTLISGILLVHYAVIGAASGVFGAMTTQWLAYRKP